MKHEKVIYEKAKNGKNTIQKIRYMMISEIYDVTLCNFFNRRKFSGQLSFHKNSKIFQKDGRQKKIIQFQVNKLPLKIF